MKQKPKKIKPKKQIKPLKQASDSVSKENDPISENDSMDFGGIPNLNLKKNLGCGG